MKDKYVVVIGASNIDIGGQPSGPLIFADSNPGVISVSYGGVGRNIAHNISKLGISTRLISAFGGDSLGRDLQKVCTDLNIDISDSLICSDRSSSMYMYINDEECNMHIAVSHVDIIEEITPEYIDSVSDIINGAAAVVSDCNLTEDTLHHLINICKSPLYIDTVSTAHSHKIKNNLSGIHTLKPNKIEAEYLTGIKIDNDDDFIEAADILIKQGVKRVFISAGSEGIVAADENNIYKIGRYPVHVASTTGAGDAAMAAIVWSSLTHPDDIVFASKAANAAASVTISVFDTNHPQLSTEMIDNKIRSYEAPVICLK